MTFVRVFVLGTSVLTPTLRYYTQGTNPNRVSHIFSGAGQAALAGPLHRVRGG